MSAIVLPSCHVPALPSCPPSSFPRSRTPAHCSALFVRRARTCHTPRSSSLSARFVFCTPRSIYLYISLGLCTHPSFVVLVPASASRNGFTPPRRRRLDYRTHHLCLLHPAICLCIYSTYHPLAHASRIVSLHQAYRFALPVTQVPYAHIAAAAFAVAPHARMNGRGRST